MVDFGHWVACDDGVQLVECAGRRGSTCFSVLLQLGLQFFVGDGGGLLHWPLDLRRPAYLYVGGTCQATRSDVVDDLFREFAADYFKLVNWSVRMIFMPERDGPSQDPDP